MKGQNEDALDQEERPGSQRGRGGNHMTGSDKHTGALIGQALKDSLKLQVVLSSSFIFLTLMIATRSQSRVVKTGRL